MARANPKVEASGQDGFHFIAGASTISPARIAGATCPVTSASFGVYQPAGKARADAQADLRALNERSVPDVTI
jgi:hypothetical protein